jgi:hypothetical protein
LEHPCGPLSPAGSAGISNIDVDSDTNDADVLVHDGRNAA